MHSLLGAILDTGGTERWESCSLWRDTSSRRDEVSSPESQDINQVIHNRRHDRLFTPLSLSPCRDDRSRGQAFKLPLFLWLQDSFQPTLLSIAKAGGSQIFNSKQKKPLVHRTVSSSIIIETSLYFLHILFVAECVCQDIYVEIRAQFVGVHLLFSPCRFLGQNLGHYLGDKDLYPLSHLIDCIAPLMNTFIKH